MEANSQIHFFNLKIKRKRMQSLNTINPGNNLNPQEEKVQTVTETQRSSVSKKRKKISKLKDKSLESRHSGGEKKVGENEHNIKIQVKIKRTGNRSIEVGRSKSLCSTEPVSHPRVGFSSWFRVPEAPSQAKLPLSQWLQILSHEFEDWNSRTTEAAL